MNGPSGTDSPEIVFEVGGALVALNQTLDYAYPTITILGELSSFRVSRGKWLYFDLKDEYAQIKFFGTVYNIKNPLEDGMMLKVKGRPYIHELYGFSIQILNIDLAGEGTIKKAAQLLGKKLEAEGLFSPERKRILAFPPKRIGLIASTQSAAYADFVKVINARYGGLSIEVYDVQVQGDPAVNDICSAIQHFNQQQELVDILVITRGGGSAEDLAAFNTEQLVRAVAASRIPTLVAIGHEVDLSLAELAADSRASTPSNAAELLVPDRRELISELLTKQKWLQQAVDQSLKSFCTATNDYQKLLAHTFTKFISEQELAVSNYSRILEALNPESALKRGYAIVRSGNKVITNSNQTTRSQKLSIRLSQGSISATVD